MKAFYLPLGNGAGRGLPRVLTAMSCGAARQTPEVSVLRIALNRPEDVADRLLADLNACHRLLGGEEAFAFFRTEWRCGQWIPTLPERDALAEGEESRLLLQALRGDGVPFSFRTDREAAEWSMSALLDRMAEETSGSGDENAPFLSFLAEVQACLDAGEEVRILLACDLTEEDAAGMTLALLRFLRGRFPENAPFLGLIGLVRSSGAAPEGAGAASGFLAALRDRDLLRVSDDRTTSGADAFWLLGLPASLRGAEDGGLLLDWAAARVMGEVWTGRSRPASGLHTREMPGILTLHSLGQEAAAAATFLRGSVWCLSDLFPALRSWFEHPALLRSLAPATRGGLFRRLFRDPGEGGKAPEELNVLERTMRVFCLETLTLIRTLPVFLREAEVSDALWHEAVQACGRTVTLASEYDVRRKEAEDSGVDKVQPVHRDSLSDTEEEKLIHSLDRLGEDVAAAQGERAEVFRRMGGYPARAALEDCLAKCRVAEVSAREKMIQMPAGTPEERYALGMQERRVRLLKAAIARCEADLRAAKAWPELSRAGSLRPSQPCGGEMLDPALAEHLAALLTAEGDSAAEQAKAVRDGLSGMLKGFVLNDAKMLLKNLLSVCRQPEEQTPMRSLMAGVFSVCGVEISGLRFQSAGTVPDLALLPDLTEEGSFFSIVSAPERLLTPEAEDRTARDRGLLALMILRQYRRGGPLEAGLEVLPLREEDSGLIRIYLSSRGLKEAFLCSLRMGEGETLRRQPLAVILPGRGLEPARLQTEGMSLVPSFACWLDRENRVFQDPCAYLSEGDRQILTQQLTRLRAALNDAPNRDLADFLSDWHRDIMQSARQEKEEDDLRRRLRIVCGLTRLPIWQKELRKVSSFFESGLTEDAVCGALAGREEFEAAAGQTAEETLYLFRGTPIARENAKRLIEGTRVPEEPLYLSSLDTECDILFHSSDDYHDALAAGLQDLLRRYPGAEPEARETAEKLLAEAREPVTDRVTELEWPWDTVSASVLTILTECLGKELAAPALQAFSEKLALFPARGGDILGDVMLSAMCVLNRAPSAGEEAPAEGTDADPAEGNAPTEGAPAFRPDAALPPLSPEFAVALCRSPQGRSLIQPGLLNLRADGAGVRAELTLEGAFTLKLIRRYAPEEILSFYAHDLPTLALWPSLPFPAELWQAYHSYAHGPEEFQFTAVTQEERTVLTGSGLRSSARQKEFPLCYLISWKETPIGAVPNLLPAPEIPEGGSWTACVDFGASAASVIFTDGQARWPMQGPVTVRTLLRSPAASEDLMRREFLPAVPVSPLIPAALRIFRNDPADQQAALRDAAILMSSSLQDVLTVSPEALYTDLKWNAEKGRAAGLYLHQVMLMAALQARCGGARQLNWRFSLPEEMAAEGRERLADTFRALAEEVAGESGLSFPDKQPPVAFASESASLGAYFRLVSPDQTRGGFMALDLGADMANLSLYLQGREEAVRVCQLPMGLHNLLLPPLLRRPEILREDFGFVEDPAFQRDLEDLQALLARAGREPAALRQARYALDAILADHFPLFLNALGQRRAAGEPGRTGALILLYDCFLMMLSGLALLQISGDSLRNDTLPDTMTLFLAGRGSLLMEAMSPPVKTSLWRMLTMFRNNRVSSLNLLFSAEKKLEIPVGLSVLPRPGAALPRPASAPAAIAVRPEELMPEFLLRFRRDFPAEAAMLFPGVYANDPFAPFTPYGQQLLGQALQAAFGRRETGRPYPALVSCLHLMLEMIQEGTVL